MNEIEIISRMPDDFKNFFETNVKDWLHKVHNEEIKKIVLTASPYRPYGAAISWINKEKGILSIDFYSALRAGFGELDFKEVMIALNYDNEINPNINGFIKHLIEDLI